MGLKLVYFISFIDLFALGLVFPLFRPYLEKLGASELQFGLLESSNSLIAFFTGPIAGSLSDSKGRKFVLTITLALTLLGYAILGLSNSLVCFLIGRLMISLFNKVQVLVKALIADYASKEEQAGAYATLGALSGAGFIVAPVLGGYMYQATNDFTYLTGIIIVSLSIGLGLVLLLPQDKRKLQGKDVKISAAIKGSFQNLASVKWGLYWDVFVLKLIMEVCFMMFYHTMGITLGQFGADQVNIGYILAFHTILLIIGNLVVNKINDSFYKDDKEGISRNLHGFLILGLAFLGFALAPNYWIYVAFVVPLSLIRGLFDSCHTAVMLARTNEEDKGVLMGALESAMPFAGFFAPLIFGVVGHFGGADALRFIGLPPVSLGALLLLWMQRKSDKKSRGIKRPKSKTK